MRAVVFDGREASFVTDYPLPVAAADECLVRVELAAVCSTDREILRGYRPGFSGVMGHEFVGVVVSSPDGQLDGQRVVGEINLSCGECIYCTSGRPTHCAQRRCLGINAKDGCFAEYLTLPMGLLHPVPASIPPEVAVYTEPLAAALHITGQVDFTPQLPVAILGDGRLALMICQSLAANTQAELTVIGRHASKLALFSPYAKTVTSGAAASGNAAAGNAALANAAAGNAPAGNAARANAASCNAAAGSAPAGSDALPAPQSFEVVIDATGSPTSLRQAIAWTRSLGTLVLKSTYAGTTEVDMSEIVVRELTIIGSRCGDFAPALRLLQSGQVDFPPLELHAPGDFSAAFFSPAFKAALDFR
ncbi:MAG: alcohol dehydrogenase catalytic domain-containing protein [Coriobacteriales bacterium]|jgi:threonine dehydrogenase-like Zn-dependent dehydrogenase|nr:alcohol dehydrogenase catalytic domain-containing protein [Coriobacteriales bacterium]